MTAPAPTILLIGLKGSGKTTYLAALWHLLEAQEISCALRTPTLQPERDYLNRIRLRWLRLQPMLRSVLQQPQTFSVLVEDQLTGQSASIVFPDISGEVFRMQWEDREVPADYFELEQRARSALLFVHPNEVKRSVRIGADVNSTNNELENSDSTNSEPEEGPSSSSTVDSINKSRETSWHAKFSPTQVQLVDVLQNYLRANVVRPLRLSVVVSAWDLLEKIENNPETWFEAGLPLLSQFLVARRGEIQTRYFGVSAQGGDLESERQRLDLAKAAKPSERVFVVEEGKRHRDLTAIVRWSLGI